MASDRLKVVALVSGGKDSFFNLLHCIHHGHDVVALANLYPASGPGQSLEVDCIDPNAPAPTSPADQGTGTAPASDLNSFMYQTVGHEIVPLYAAATGLPLYRQPIQGGAETHERDYDHAPGSRPSSPQDEAESMLSLLQAVKARHPDATAVCAGAILSTYQRTRVESIALRLGLVPLAYLWKYPVLPPPSVPADEAQLLRDMAAAQLQARIIKVASAGLDETHLWECITSDVGAARVKRALARFGTGDGAVLGEGGEFETIVVDGPAHLFKKRICVPVEEKKVVAEEGGTSWLMLRCAYLEDKHTDAAEPLPKTLRTPELLDAGFRNVLEGLQQLGNNETDSAEQASPSALLKGIAPLCSNRTEMRHLTVLANPDTHDGTIQAEIVSVVDQIRHLMSSASLNPSDITTATIILRDMADFPRLNAEYGKLFRKPNPPSRVTISCGPLLPDGHNIVVYLTLPSLPENSSRNGLHVQSRSYWAPANIGPYSQAIDVPVTSCGQQMGLRCIFVAGQIPLIPATMLLPPPSDTSLQLQIVLSLQHLWRISAQMKIQYFTSAVAYFARSSSSDDMQQNAKHAGLAWKLIHADTPEDDEDADDGPDPWDLKYNPQYASLSSSGPETAAVSVPDLSILTPQQRNGTEPHIPPFFAAEVESLPRDSAVEWHGHIGLSGASQGSAELCYYPNIDAAGWAANHVLVRTSDGMFMHTALHCPNSDDGGFTSWSMLEEALTAAYQGALQGLGVKATDDNSTNHPYLLYVDASRLRFAWSKYEGGRASVPFAIIPCRSLWSHAGKGIGCVALYKTILGGV
ncbi:hypothetical protein S7711_08856 [Stachybotrys chartarum IBT 7711]|uniref:Diphthine--ammonia ligase n=1 Tax=Stachybotrys chartarum (strain CBS 109288 / IBT 7711) TaxID=1280523 RepID=A0A084B145_STACB|nr:hypothetical protein S7711_08856 [Stachybotrys chartarum IBT 7711]